MIPSYKKYAKQSQFENDSDVRNYCINKRLQPNGHLVSWEKRTQNEPNGMLFKINWLIKNLIFYT